MSSDILVELPGGLKPDSTGGYNNNNNTLSISCSDQTYNTRGISLVKVQVLTLAGSSRTQGEFRKSASLLIRHKISSYPLESCSKSGKRHNCTALLQKMKRRRGNQCCWQCPEVFPWLVWVLIPKFSQESERERCD